MTPAQTGVERVARAIMDHRLGAGTYDNASLWQGADAEKEETRREARDAPYPRRHPMREQIGVRRVSLLHIINRAFELHKEAGHMVETERDAEDFVARVGNGGERVRIIVGPLALYATCSRGCSQSLSVPQDADTNEVMKIGMVAKSVLLHAIRRKMEDE